MKILAMDMASETLSVAVVADKTILAELSRSGHNNHSIYALESIDWALRTARTSLADLDGLAITIGPGSFTGLRIGLSLVKGLALAAEKPVVGVSSLKALAAGIVHYPHPVCALLDARKKEVYHATYEVTHGRIHPLNPESVCAPKDLTRQMTGPCLFVGKGALKYRHIFEDQLGDSARFGPGDSHVIRASRVAWLAMDQLRTQGGQGDDVHSLIPVYIRKSDAEINRRLAGAHQGAESEKH